MRALASLDNAQPPASNAEAVAGSITVTSDIATGFNMIDETACRKMRVVETYMIDERPKRAGRGWGLQPAREIGSGILERESGRKVHANQCSARHIVCQPFENLTA